MAEDSEHQYSEHKSTVRSSHEDHASLADAGVGETPLYPLSLFANPALAGRGNAPVQISLMTQVQRTYGNRIARNLVRNSSPDPVASSSNSSRAVQRFLQRSTRGSAPAEDHTAENTPIAVIQRQHAPDQATDEASAIQDCLKHAAGWMKGMIKEMSAMDLAHLRKMQEVTEGGKVPGIDSVRLAAAIDAALAAKTSSALKGPTLDWLAKNAEKHADQVGDIRDAVGLATFEPAFIKVVSTLGDAIKAKRATYDTTMASTTVANNAQGVADPHTDNENRRRLTETTFRDTEPLLKALKEITKGRAARYKCDNKSAEDAILATLELEAVFSAEATLASPGTAREDSAGAVGQNKNLAWCGAFAAKSYMESEILPVTMKSFPSTERLEEFFHYKQYLGTEPLWVFVDGEWKSVEEYHTKRDSKRKWLSDAAIFKGGTLDIRPGDIVMLDNNPNTRVEIEVADPSDPAKKITKTVAPSEVPQGAKQIRTIPGEKADHIQMVQSWNPATRELFIIEGNSDGYIVDTNPAHPDPQGETPDQKTKRQEIEAATGKKLKPGTDASHVAVGVIDLAHQPDPAALALPRKARVYGIGRLSVVDFETQSYNPSKEKPKDPPKDKK